MDLIRSPLAVALLMFLVCCGECSARSDDWTADEVAIARLVVSEASFRATDDVRPITWIVVHGARRRGLSPAEYVARVHHRHTRNVQRPWLAGLDATITEPTGWPESVSWSDRGAPAWTRRLAAVREAMRDGRHGCDAVPTTWGSPRLDADRIHQLEGMGFYRLRCGSTANVILGRRR